MTRGRLLLALGLLSLVLLTPSPGRAVGPMCGRSWTKDQPGTCTFAYAGGEVFVVGIGIPRFRESAPNAPLGPEVAVVADVMTNPLDENSVVLRCAGAPGTLPGNVAIPAACADGRPSILGLPMGFPLVCRGQGSTHGFVFCLSNNL